MKIYHTLVDGRIVELKLGGAVDSNEMFWARSLSEHEIGIYLELKAQGLSDTVIFDSLNQRLSLETDPMALIWN